jgi:prepilin-type N-terminal cleavage/methylation domain-containing protein
MGEQNLTIRAEAVSSLTGREHRTSAWGPSGLPLERRAATGRRATGGRPAGFTLIELMIVVVVIGILAAIAIPNFLGMQKRANEGSIKSNMHTVQMSVEDFGLLNDGIYPTSASDAVPDGRTLAQVCPTGAFPKNPYTRLTSVVLFNANPTSGNKGELAINPAAVTNYLIKGNGSDGDTLSLTLTSGQ